MVWLESSYFFGKPKYYHLQKNIPEKNTPRGSLERQMPSMRGYPSSLNKGLEILPFSKQMFS